MRVDHASPRATSMRRRHSTVGDSGSSPAMRERDRVVVAVLQAAGEPPGAGEPPRHHERRRAGDDVLGHLVTRPGGVQDLDGQPRRDLRRAERRQRVVERVRRAHRQRQRARAAGVDGERDRLGRRPQPRPVARRQGEAHAVAGGHGVGDGLHRDPDVERLADRDVARVLVVVGVAEVQEPAGDDRRGAVGGDVAQSRGDERTRPVGADPQRHDRLPEQLGALGDRCGVEGQRAGVVAALVDRHVGRVAVARTRRRRRARRSAGSCGRARCRPSARE